MQSLQIGFLLSFGLASLLATLNTHADPVSPDAPPPPNFDASSYILVDYDSGIILAERDPDKTVEPASLTKIMTSYIAAE
ncbi:MAG: hypothetical protein O3C28_05945, partial [Proteobacteria bacterium]|nr:hypothetical protein [Pseudomonadota bacterium]